MIPNNPLAASFLHFLPQQKQLFTTEEICEILEIVPSDFTLLTELCHIKPTPAYTSEQLKGLTKICKDLENSIQEIRKSHYEENQK